MEKLFITILVLFPVGICFGQKADEPQTVSATASACENNPAALLHIRDEAQKTSERVFVIFRAGKNETEIVNNKRLTYMKNIYLKGWAEYNKINVIYARGEKSADSGKIEYYVGGKLLLVTIAPKNKTPCLDCCGTDFYYPQNLLPKRKTKYYKHYQKK